MTDQSAVDALRAALKRISDLTLDVPAAHGNPESYYLGQLRTAIGTAARALAASATDEAEERRVVRDSEWTPLRKDVRPAVPALDVERLARAMARSEMTFHTADEAEEHWESYRDEAQNIAREYAALRSKEPTE